MRLMRTSGKKEEEEEVLRDRFSPRNIWQVLSCCRNPNFEGQKTNWDVEGVEGKHYCSNLNKN